jgi:hypothetical protein
MSGSLYDIIAGAESSGCSNTNGPFTSSGQAQGCYQITTGTWQQYAPNIGVDLGLYPTAASAPVSVQTQVASSIPLSRWAPSTVQAVENAFGGNVDPSQTLGQIAGGQGGASAGGSAGSSGSSGSSSQAQGWLSSIGSWVGAYATRGVLIVVAIVLLIGGLFLFASRTQVVQELAGGAAKGE